MGGIKTQSNIEFQGTADEGYPCGASAVWEYHDDYCHNIWDQGTGLALGSGASNLTYLIDGICLRLYYVGELKRYWCNTGSIEVKSYGSMEVTEPVDFSGGRGQLSYPASYVTPDWTTVGSGGTGGGGTLHGPWEEGSDYPSSNRPSSFEVVGTDVIANLPGDPNLVEDDPNAESCEPDAGFEGTVTLSYTANYRLFLYKPEYSIIDKNSTAKYPGTLAKFGTVYARTECGLAKKDIEVNMSSADKDANELYRLTSMVLNNRNGAWEVPTTWPNSGWPNEPDSPQGDSDVYMSYSRTHEMGFFSLGGTVNYYMYSHPSEQPIEATSWSPISSGNYKPKLTLKFVGVDSYKGTKLESAYNDVDVDQVLKDVSSRWSGYSVTLG